MTNHNKAVANFLASHPTWHRVGLRKKLNAVFAKEEVWELPPLGFVPDAFEINESHRAVRLLEVDGHSYTNSDKMFLIASFWYEMDSRSWSIELRTIDLFTGASSILSDSKLARHWFDRYVVA
jgi:hypothetical protein